MEDYAITVRMKTTKSFDNFFDCPNCKKKELGFHETKTIHSGKFNPVKCRNCGYESEMSLTMELKG